MFKTILESISRLFRKSEPTEVKVEEPVSDAVFIVKDDYTKMKAGEYCEYTVSSLTGGSHQGNYRACDWSRWLMHWLATSGGMQVVNDYCTRTNQDPSKVVPYLLNRLGSAYRDEPNKYRQITSVFLGWRLSQYNKYTISIDKSDENVVTFKLSNLIWDTVVTTINKVRVPANAMAALDVLIGCLDGCKIHDISFSKWHDCQYHSLEEIVSVLSKSFYSEDVRVHKDLQQELVFIGDTLILATERIEA